VLLATQQDAATYLRAGIVLAVGLALYFVSRAAGATEEAIDDREHDGEADSGAMTGAAPDQR
jgi:hypothetical protein